MLTTAKPIIAVILLLAPISSVRSQQAVCSPPTFVKTWGNSDRFETVGALTRSSDGSLVLAGRNGSVGNPNFKTFLQKISSSGEVIETKTLNVDQDEAFLPIEIIEDSEGMIVGCGTLDGNNVSPGTAVIFRYDQAADSLMWLNTIGKEASRVEGILEKSPGGNYIFYQNPDTSADPMFVDYSVEILEVDRATGQIIPGFANRYDYIFLDQLEKMVMANGALFGLGNATCRYDYGIKSNRAMLVRFDPTNGTPLWTHLSHEDTSLTTDYKACDLAADGNELVLAYLKDEDVSNWPIKSGPIHVHLQKTDLDGNMLWVRKLEYVVNTLQISVVQDGYILSGQRSLGNALHYAIKLDKDGTFQWGRELNLFSGSNSSTNTDYYGPNLSEVIADSLYVSRLVNTGKTINGFLGPEYNYFMWKLLTDGTTADPCSLITPIVLQTIDVSNPVNTPVVLDMKPSSAATAPLSAIWSATTFDERLNCPEYAPLQVNCTDDITVVTAAGSPGTAVQYDLPDATGVCDCPGFTFTLAQGLNSGSTFPVGATTVCYLVQDDCATSNTCCFTVSVVADQSACDTKKIGCMQYDLLGIEAGPGHSNTYRIRVTNNCSNEMTYTVIQLPNGVTADGPGNGAVYTAPGGNPYIVRNPNSSPFHSIRFKSPGAGISNGASDVFEYSLPLQSQPAYIHIASRLEPFLYYEAHLNTFNCPITSPATNKSAERSGAPDPAQNALLLFPNPTDGAIFADLSKWQGQDVQVRITNGAGLGVVLLQIRAGSETQAIELSDAWPSGLYFVETVSRETGERAAAQFILER